MVEVTPTFARILKVWWLILWRGMAAGFLGGALAGLLIGVFSAMIGLTLELAELATMIMGGLAGLAAGLWAVSCAFEKSFSDFRVVLVRGEDSTQSAADSS